MVSLPQETFVSSGASVKCSLLFLQKFTEAEQQRFEETLAAAKAEAAAHGAEEADKEQARLETEIAAAKQAKDADRRKALQKELKDFLSRAEDRQAAEARRRLKERLDYPIFMYEAEKVGITATGEEEQNELYPNANQPAGCEKTCLEWYREFKADAERFSGEKEGRQFFFAVRFSELESWSVAAQFSSSWNWPDDCIAPLSSILARRNEAALDSLNLETTVNLLTIRFDGSIEPREPVQIKNIKGRLFRVYPGDVVFSKIDVRNGAIGLAPDDIDCMCVTAEFPVYSVDAGKSHPEYVKLLFRTAAFKELLNSMISGASGRKRIQPSQLERVKVPIPPLPVQRKIVEHWEKAQNERFAAEAALSDLVAELNAWLAERTKNFKQTTHSKVFITNFVNIQQWDVKAGRAAVFSLANPDFIPLGNFTEECAETVAPWNTPEKEWPIYGVNNKEGVFLSANQPGKEFNAAYKIIKKDWFFHNPTRANVGSLGIVPEVPDDAITSPEYQVWRLKGGFLPEFMALMLRTEYFLALVAFNRVGGVKQRMYYSNLAEIRIPAVPDDLQRIFSEKRQKILCDITAANTTLAQRKGEIEQMILGTVPL